MMPPAAGRGGLPRGSAYGLFAIVGLTALVPFLIVQSLVPVIGNGLDVWLGSLLPVLGASAVAACIVTVGLYRRQGWYIGFVFAYGSVLLAGAMAGFCLGVAVLLGVLPTVSANLHFISFVNVIEWVIFSPLAWLLLRMLRLAYWRPWTAEAEWEKAGIPGAPRTPIGMWVGRKK